MKIAIGCDHGGFALKQPLAELIASLGHAVLDCGALQCNEADDYPDFACAVGHAIQRGDAERGVVICGSGVGVVIAANKLRDVRACLCHDTYSARQGVEHDDMNVLGLGALIIGEELAKELVRAFLSAKFSNDQRFARRLKKVSEIESSRQNASIPVDC